MEVKISVNQVQQKGKVFQSKQTSKVDKCFRRQQKGKIF